MAKVRIEKVHWIPKAFLFLSTIGLIGAIYLTWEHYADRVVPCAINGCETVLTSSYSTIGKAPLSALGILYYILIFLLSLVYITVRNNKSAEKKYIETFKQINPKSKIDSVELLLKVVSFLGIIGVLISSYSVYLQLEVIGAICQHCMLSAVASTSIFVVGMYYLNGAKKSSS